MKKHLPILIVEFHHKNFNKIKKELRKMKYIDYIFLPEKNYFFKIDKIIYKKILKKTTSTNIIFYSNKSKYYL